MQCTNCGFSVSQEDNVCSNCGHILKSGFRPSAPTAAPPQSTPAAAPPPPAQPAPTTAPYRPDKKKAVSKIGWIVAVVAILILAAVAFGPELLGLSRPSQVAAYQTQEAQDAQYAAVQAQQQKTSEARNEAFAIWTDYVRMMNGFLDDWDAAYQRTTSSNRAEIGTQIDELIEIYEEINSTQIDPRFGRAHGTMLESLASAIQSFQTWQEGGSGHESMMDDYRSLRADWFDLVNQVEH